MWLQNLKCEMFLKEEHLCVNEIAKDSDEISIQGTVGRADNNIPILMVSWRCPWLVWLGGSLSWHWVVRLDKESTTHQCRSEAELSTSAPSRPDGSVQ
jgi:hypothetical protein